MTFTRKHWREQGFTLVEILVVMVIIGILASLIAGNFVGTRLKARDSKRKNDINQVKSSLEAFYNDHHAYPPADANGNITYNNVVVTWGTDPLVDANGTVYMATLPDDPVSTMKYVYVTDDSEQKYQIFAHLENTNNSDEIRTDLTQDCSSGAPTATSTCNYGVSSSNTTLLEDLLN